MLGRQLPTLEGDNTAYDRSDWTKRHTHSHLITQIRGELCRVGEVSVVCHTDTVRVVRVQRLRFSTRRGTGRGVPDMTKPNVTTQIHHVVSIENVLHQPVVLAEVQPAIIGRYNPGSVLPAVLQHGESVKQHLVADLILIGH